MKSSEERFAVLQDALFSQGIECEQVDAILPTICAPYGDDLSHYGFKRISWAPFIWQGDEPIPSDHALFKEHKIFAIGLASVLACLQLNLQPGHKVLDVCAAPGIKSLYLQFLHNKQLQLFVNDTSHNRLQRLRRLFTNFEMPLPIFTSKPGQSLASVYSKNSFDAIIVDAPCSGEGNILAGDEATLQSWSVAKVKRLANIQRKIIKATYPLVSDNGTFIYSTCTLNAYENERAITKAGHTTKTDQAAVNYSTLQPNQSLRILPNSQSIGFFIARLK